MSIFYFVEATLDTEAHHEVIHKILTCGLKENFSYKNSPYHENKTTLGEAINTVLQDLGTKKKACLYPDFENTSCLICFYITDLGLLKISLGGFGAYRKKKFNNDHYDVDFAYYIMLLLRLCDNLCIVELKTTSDYDFS